VNFKVRLTSEAQSDLERQFDFVLERELSRAVGDLELPEKALAAVRAGVANSRSSPFTCRRVGRSPFLRELIFPFGRSGQVALLEIEGEAQVSIVAIRHQLEDDYH
jgi:plasmid stabilization system protein ParE